MGVEELKSIVTEIIRLSIDCLSKVWCHSTDVLFFTLHYSRLLNREHQIINAWRKCIAVNAFKNHLFLHPCVHGAIIVFSFARYSCMQTEKLLKWRSVGERQLREWQRVRALLLHLISFLWISVFTCHDLPMKRRMKSQIKFGFECGNLVIK